MNKKHLYTELSYILAILTLAFGTALMEKANFGMSMVVAPAYIIHLVMSKTYAFYTFGTSEYLFQLVLLLLITLCLRKFKICYLFSFVTAVIYGLTLDCMIGMIASFDMTALGLPELAWRLILFLLGMVICAIGISLFFHAYITPEAYELFVKEMSEKTGIEIHKFKTGYDLSSLCVSVIMSFVFFGFGHFEGVKLGTLFCALINGSLIGICSGFFEKHFDFVDALPKLHEKYFS